jgi:hypothetical protein
LPTCAIETYYPQPLHRTETEEDAMNGKKKVPLGKRVGKEITQAQFETDLRVVFDVLNEC